jgi:hypothetical protein
MSASNEDRDLGMHEAHRAVEEWFVAKGLA